MKTLESSHLRSEVGLGLVDVVLMAALIAFKLRRYTRELHEDAKTGVEKLE